MIFTPTKLNGSFIIDLEQHGDERGFFARAWCQKEFVAHGLNENLVQCNISYNQRKGTIRGLHYQIKPYEESKLVRCLKGAIMDVIIDLRSSSVTYKQWIAVELSESNRRALYVPEGFAHGFQTLKDDTELFYQVSQFFAPEYERGVRWNDPVFNIAWPLAPTMISEKDQSYQLFQDAPDGRLSH